MLDPLVPSVNGYTMLLRKQVRYASISLSSD